MIYIITLSISDSIETKRFGLTQKKSVRIKGVTYGVSTAMMVGGLCHHTMQKSLIYENDRYLGKTTNLITISTMMFIGLIRNNMVVVCAQANRFPLKLSCYIS